MGSAGVGRAKFGHQRLEPISRLLADANRGGSIVITRRGSPIAGTLPEADRRRQEVDRALDPLHRP
jgi:hypothetical protein